MQDSTTETNSFSRLMDNEDQFQPPELSVKSLFDAGAHFGHRKVVWHPKSAEYIYSVVDGVTIINLDLTVQLWMKARKFIHDRASVGGRILFVGTKEIAKEIVKNAAIACGEFYCVNRWLGGTLTNFQTVRNSIAKLKELENLIAKVEDKSEDVWLAKKEVLKLKREVEKLTNYLGGVREMIDLPQLLIIFDIKKDQTALKEAIKLQIPVVALVDTNVDPTLVNFPIPCNDDSIKAIEIFAYNMAAAVLEGKREFNKKPRKRGFIPN